VPLTKYRTKFRFLSLDVIRWRTPEGRSQNYVNPILKYCPETKIYLGNAAKTIHSQTKRNVRKACLVLKTTAKDKTAAEVENLERTVYYCKKI
jgi:hypothetical protein